MHIVDNIGCGRGLTWQLEPFETKSFIHTWQKTSDVEVRLTLT